MKRLVPVLLAIVSLPCAHRSFAQTSADNKEPEATLSEDSSPARAESTGEVTTKNTEVEEVTPAEQAFQRALNHAKDNKLEDAIADCTEAIRLDPENTDYLIKRAEFYRDSGNFDKGLDDASKILETDPNDERARVLGGKMLEFSGNRDKALIEFNTAVERNPGSVQALLERSRYFQRQGDRDLAMADADRIVQLQPESPVGYLARAETHITFGEAEQAMNYAPLLFLQDVADAENWQTYAARAAARTIKGDFTGADQDFQTALRLSPDNAIVLSMRGGFYFDTGDYEKSLADMERAVELAPEDHVSKAALADLLATCPDERVRNGKKAGEYAAEALDQAPDDPDVWRACAAAAAENGNFEEATRWQQRAIASTGVSALQKWDSQERLEAYKGGKPYRDNLVQRKTSAMVDEASYASKNGDFDRAIALLSEVISVNPTNADAHARRGCAYDRVKKYDLAIADLTAAIHGNPKDVDAHYWRSHAFYQTGEYARAIDDLKQMEAASTPRITDVLNGLAWIYSTCPDHRFRDSGKAAEYMERALEQKPDDPFFWDTCAAVFAEDEDFDDAVDWEQACINSKDIPDEVRRGCQQRLLLYQQHLPYRDEPESVQLARSAAHPGK